jgi:glycosyltransferase involved in cell wall biosynthesis
MSDRRDRSVGLVHDYLLVERGAERTFREIAACVPGAPIHTLLYDPKVFGACFAGRRIRTSWLQHLGVRQRGFRACLPLLPTLAERLPLTPYRVVLSSSSAFAHGVRTAEDAVHICYCHSPFRYAWHERELAISSTPAPARWLVERQLDRIREWDLEAVHAVDHFIANSRTTADRIERFWGRTAAAIVHPPVLVERFTTAEPEDFLLVVGELVPHKRTEIALEAARRAGQRIVVVGDGPARPKLESRFGGTSHFVGRVSDRELARLYSRAKALIVPGIEEFGITAVEAQASGRPVLAARSGGALETVVEGETGAFFEPGSVEGLTSLLQATDFSSYSPSAVRRNAERFSASQFRSRYAGELQRLLGSRFADLPRAPS